MPFCLSLSILVAIFSGGPGLASIRMSQFWILLELRMELWHVQCHSQNNTQFMSPNQQCHSIEGKVWIYASLKMHLI